MKIALLVPLTGPWARQGILERMGAEMAIDDINAAGGIKALGGAKLKLLVIDTQDTAEKAKDAAQRMMAQEPDLVGGIGCWLSTFTLAVTEVSERAQLPWLTLSYSDRSPIAASITCSDLADRRQAGRPMSCRSSWNWPQDTTGKRPTKVAIIGDNTAASVSFLKPIREHSLKDAGLTAVVDKIYTPPLADATTLVQPVRSARPDFVLLLSTNVPDDKLLADAFTQYGMGGGKFR